MGIIVGILMALMCCVWFIWGIIAVGTIGNIVMSNISIMIVIGFIVIISSISNSVKENDNNDKYSKTLLVHICIYFAAIIIVSLLAVSLSNMNEYTGITSFLSIILLLFLNLPAFSIVSDGQWDDSFSIEQNKNLTLVAVIANLFLGIVSFYPYIIYGANTELWNTLRYSPSILVYICPSIMAILYLRVVYKGITEYIRLNNK